MSDEERVQVLRAIAEEARATVAALSIVRMTKGMRAITTNRLLWIVVQASAATGDTEQAARFAAMLESMPARAAHGGDADARP